MNVIVGSENPVKIEAALEAFKLAFPEKFKPYELAMQRTSIVGFDADSGIPNQPKGMDETYTGAVNRVLDCQRNHPDADYYVAMEGGVEKYAGKLFTFAVAIVRSKSGDVGMSRSSSIMLPPKVAQLIDQGIELGPANDQVFGLKDSKKKMGTTGILTKGIFERSFVYKEAVVMALSRFLNEDLFKL